MARTTKCMCPNCNNVGTHKVELFRRGNGNSTTSNGFAYMCDFHYHREEFYSTKNNNKHGVEKANKTTIGVEFETSASTKKARIEFMANGYLPTEDITVNVEYKSPIMNGLNALAKHCVTFDRLIENGDLEVGYNCGTHLHIGNAEKLNSDTLDYIRRFYHSLFIPLQAAMLANPDGTEQLFGRGFDHWCDTINEYTRPANHTNFINMQHEYTIEFRMCKFINAKQYMHAVHFCVDVTNAIIKNFIEHFNDNNFDTRRYVNITDYRKHKANVTAKKLVKLFEKYTNQ